MCTPITLPFRSATRHLEKVTLDHLVRNSHEMVSIELNAYMQNAYMQDIYIHKAVYSSEFNKSMVYMYNDSMYDVRLANSIDLIDSSVLIPPQYTFVHPFVTSIVYCRDNSIGNVLLGSLKLFYGAKDLPSEKQYKNLEKEETLTTKSRRKMLL